MSSLANEIIFVTGATGFVGRNLIRRLVKENPKEIRLLVRCKPDSDVAKRFTSLSNRIKLFHGDVHTLESIKAGINGSSIVFHLAAHVKVWLVQLSNRFDHTVHNK